MEKFRLKRDGQRDVVFFGEMLANGSSSYETAASNYSGETGNAYKIRAYKTESGKYVLEYAYITIWQGCNDEFIVEIHETLESLLASKLLASRKLEKKWLVEELELEPEEI